MAATLPIKTEYDFFSSYVPDADAAKTYINILHHDLENCGSGYVCQFVRSADNKKIKSLSFTDLDKVIDVDAANIKKPGIYCSVHRYRSYKRTTQDLWAITGIVIDLDDHDHTGKALEIVKDNTKTILNKAFSTGDLLRPTMAVDSSRGLHIYYILPRSIANIEATASYRRYYDLIYDLVLRAYKDVLSDPGLLEVDEKVKSKTQLVRIPGYINYNTGKVAKLYKNDVKYYSLDDIRIGCRFDDRYKLLSKTEYDAKKKNDNNEKKKAATKFKMAKVVNLSDFKAYNLNVERLKIYENILRLKKEQGLKNKYREQLCFYYYNAAASIDRKAAKDMLKSFNAMFEIPIENKRLESIISAVDNCVNKYGQKGWYPIKNDHIIEKLKLSLQDAQAVGLGGINRKNQREEAKALTQSRRERRKAIIKEIRTSHPELDRAGTLDKVNTMLSAEGIKTISLTQLSRDCKTMKLDFYQKVLPYVKTAEYIHEQERKKKRLESKIVKLPKSDTKCCFVVGENETSGVVDLDSSLKGLAAFQAKLSDKASLMTSSFIEYVDTLSLSAKQEARLAAALNYMVASYSAWDWPDQIVYDLDYIYGRLQTGSSLKNVKIFNMIISPDVYEKGAEWTDRPLTIVPDVKPSSCKHKTIDKFKDMEFNRILWAYEAMETFEAWIKSSGYQDFFNILKSCSYGVFKNFVYCNRMKLKGIVSRWKNVLYANPSIDTVNLMIDAEFGVSSDKLVILPPRRTDKQKAAAITRRSNQALWDWIFKGTLTSAERVIADYYHYFNKKFKEDLTAVYVYHSCFAYTADVLKKKILYKLTIDDLKSMSSSLPINEDDFMEKAIYLIETRDDCCYAA